MEAAQKDMADRRLAPHITLGLIESLVAMSVQSGTTHWCSVMERALLGAPGAAPQDSDTPSEVLARAVANRTLRTEDAAALVEVFAEARFSTHTMTETHREAAERALRGVLSDLRAVR